MVLSSESLRVSVTVSVYLNLQLITFAILQNIVLSYICLEFPASQSWRCFLAAHEQEVRKPSWELQLL